jgi:hypothetical protein
MCRHQQLAGIGVGPGAWARPAAGRRLGTGRLTPGGGGQGWDPKRAMLAGNSFPPEQGKGASISRQETGGAWIGGALKRLHGSKGELAGEVTRATPGRAPPPARQPPRRLLSGASAGQAGRGVPAAWAGAGGRAQCEGLRAAGLLLQCRPMTGQSGLPALAPRGGGGGWRAAARRPAAARRAHRWVRGVGGRKRGRSAGSGARERGAEGRGGRGATWACRPLLLARTVNAGGLLLLAPVAGRGEGP